MRRVTLMLAAVLAVGWAGTAAAESAWVLWQKVTLLKAAREEGEIGYTTKADWRLREAFPTYIACKEAIASYWPEIADTKHLEQLADVKAVRKVPQKKVITIHEDESRTMQELLCLPDTIYPPDEKF